MEQGSSQHHRCWPAIVHLFHLVGRGLWACFNLGGDVRIPLPGHQQAGCRNRQSPLRGLLGQRLADGAAQLSAIPDGPLPHPAFGHVHGREDAAGSHNSSHQRRPFNLPSETTTRSHAVSDKGTHSAGMDSHSQRGTLFLQATPIPRRSHLCVPTSGQQDDHLPATPSCHTPCLWSASTAVTLLGTQQP